MTTQILEEILRGHQISDFSRKWIENNATDDDATRATYNALKSIGLSDSKIASQAHLLGMNPDTIDSNYQRLSNLGLKDEKIASQAQLLGMNPETIERNYQRLSNLGLKDEKIATQAQLLGWDPDTIERNYQRLSNLGLKDEKIASQAHLLGRDPETIERNYQNHIGLLRSNYEDRNSGKEILLQQAPLLGVSPDTLESNVQWFADRKFAYGNGVLLGTKTQTKRKKLAWILREVFDYRTHPQDQRRKVINNMYKFVADDPRLMIKSIEALEGMKEKLVEKAEEYK
jgi:hypothetical protein